MRQLPGACFHAVWATAGATAPLYPTPEDEPTSAERKLGPPPGGSTIRIIDFAPASQGGVRSPMHRTRTIDYGIVLQGEMVRLLTDSEVALKAGDVIIQRRTDHAWENRSNQPAKMAFVLIDASFAGELERMLHDESVTA